MSRATFIRHFQERLGRSASDLLTDIRMTVAANALKTSDVSTGAVAQLAGYQSEAAFQRAFKHQMGISPAQWRKMRVRSAELRLEIHDHPPTGGRGTDNSSPSTTNLPDPA
jgi:AraC family transcriptional activator of mtrCDE